ncbi:MAG: HAD-IA family hydrolase [Chromatiales bacterium]|jgi:phosphoglycolate phosphatase
MKYELLVFDWDGTLMDSVARIVACIQAAATDLDYAVPAFDEARQIIGLGLHEAVARLFQVTDPQQVQQIAERYRHHFLGDEPTPEALFPGVKELLETFESDGYLLAVATGKSRRGLDHVLANTGLANLFHATRCADETFSKPHPQMLHEIMDVLGVDAGNTLVVGDTEFDMQMARNAGTDAVGVCYGAHSEQQLRQHGALSCFDDIRQLSGWLQTDVITT